MSTGVLDHACGMRPGEGTMPALNQSLRLTVGRSTFTPSITFTGSPFGVFTRTFTIVQPRACSHC